MFLGLLTDVTDGAAYGLMCTTDELDGHNGRATSLPQPKATVNEFATKPPAAPPWLGGTRPDGAASEKMKLCTRSLLFHVRIGIIYPPKEKCHTLGIPIDFRAITNSHRGEFSPPERAATPSRWGNYSNFMQIKSH